MRVGLRNRSLTCVLLTVSLLFGAAYCFGQTFTASLTGVVTDPQGAVIPNAAVQIRNNATGDVRETASGPDGSFHFSQLLPGDYKVTARIQGFKTFVQPRVTLLATRAAELNISLQVGELAQTVEVTGTPVLLDVKSANDTATLSRTLVAELPTNTRTPLNFVFALAGTVPAPGGMYSPDQNLDQMFNSFGLHGGRSMSTQILLDGASATAADWGGLMVSPTVDSVQEMQVVTNTYDPQYGKAGGGVVNIVTKSGANEFHGEGYEFFRAENLDATPWANNTFFSDTNCQTLQCNKERKGEFKRHQFGGNIGGPVWKSKRVYFFAGFEGLRQPFTESSGPRKVPTALERAGDFSQSYNFDGTIAVIYNPFTTRPNPINPSQLIRDPFDPNGCAGIVFPATCPGNVVPSNLIDPVGAKAAGLLPLPNRPGVGDDQENNFFKVGPARQTNDKVEGRVDWAKSEKYRLFGRWSERIRQTLQPPCFYCNGADAEFINRDPGFHFTLDNTYTPNSTLVLSMLVGAGRWVEEQIPQALGRLTASDIGLNPSLFDAPIAPAFGLGRYASIGTPFGQKVRKFPRYTNTLQVNVTKERGLHSLKFGWAGESSLINNIDRFTGSFGFGRGFTSGPVAATDSGSTGNEIASLLLGTAASGDTQFNADIAGSLRYYGAYFQDAWRLSRRLTVTLGVRYEIQSGGTERFNRLAYFNPTVDNPLGPLVGLPLKGGMQFASAGNRRAWSTDTTNWAPRIGFAYQLTPKLVARGGFGIFYVPTTALWTFDQPGEHPGFSTSTTMISSQGGGGLIPQNLLSNPYPGGLTQPTGSSAGLLTFIGQSPFQGWLSGSHPTGYKQDWSLDLQYQLRPGSVIEVGYSGFGARKLMFGNPSLDGNQLPTNLLSLGSALNDPVANPFDGQPAIAGTFLAGSPAGSQGCPTSVGAPSCLPRQRLLRPFPEFDSLQWTRSWPGATANFHALNVKFTRQFSNGLSLLSTYQWSKTLDNASEDFLGWAEGSQWRDYYNRKLEYSISAHDVPQSFVTALVYQLPFGRGERFAGGASGPLNQIVGGWQVSSIIRFSSGVPVFPVLGSQPLGNYGFGFAYVNKVGDPSAVTRTAQKWFNTAAYQDINGAGFAYGDAPRFDSRLREEGSKNLDFALMKEFKAEAFKIQFRTEFLNAFNTPQFGGGGPWWSGIGNCIFCGDFGEVKGVRNLPRNIQMGRKVEF